MHTISIRRKGRVYLCTGVCGCVPKEGMYCTYERGVYLWKGCVPIEGVCTYRRGVYL